MKLLPMEIKQQDFKRVLRGYSVNEVRVFLDFSAQAFEEMFRENQELKDETRRMAVQISEFREKESTLRDAMLTAQKITADLKDSSKKEAALLLHEAEMKAERILGDAHQKMLRVMDRIQELKMERERLGSSMRSLLDHHVKMLEVALAADQALDENEKNLSFLKIQKELDRR